MNANTPVRVLVVDDHPEVRRTMIAILRSHPDVQVVGEASSGDEAIECAEQLKPTVVLMDIHIPALDGIAATRVITSRFPQIAVIGLSGIVEDYLVHAILQAGGIGLFPKEDAVRELYQYIKQATAVKQSQRQENTSWREGRYVDREIG